MNRTSRENNREIAPATFAVDEEAEDGVDAMLADEFDEPGDRARCRERFAPQAPSRQFQPPATDPRLAPKAPGTPPRRAHAADRFKRTGQLAHHRRRAADLKVRDEQEDSS
jgi:hypothetical protein